MNSPCPQGLSPKTDRPEPQGPILTLTDPVCDSVLPFPPLGPVHNAHVISLCTFPQDSPPSLSAKEEALSPRAPQAFGYWALFFPTAQGTPSGLSNPALLTNCSLPQLHFPRVPFKHDLGIGLPNSHPSAPTLPKANQPDCQLPPTPGGSLSFPSPSRCSLSAQLSATSRSSWYLMARAARPISRRGRNARFSLASA